jgi:UDP-N-acetylmuramoyl-L-alanyl-D-glutamate--2,6-diaminopimelate ligase
MMRLSEVHDYLQTKGISATLIGDSEILGVSSDSRSVSQGDLFAALPGLTVDGNKFALDAKNSKASAILTSTKNNIFESQLIVEDVRLALGIVSEFIFHSRVSEQFAVGVTGTNGKTSICYLLAQSIAQLEGKGVYVGTLGFTAVNANKKHEPLTEGKNTTPDSTDFHRFLSKHQDSKGFAVELTSIALEQKRLTALDLDVAVFTNFTRDHLDFHKTEENYFAAKKLLFTRELLSSSKPKKIAVLNFQDERIREFASELEGLPIQVWAYSVNEDLETDFRQLKLINPQLSSAGINFEIEFDGQRAVIQSELFGRYNLENLLATVTTLVALGFSLERISKIVPKLTGVPGRAQKVTIEETAIPTVLVDYAHTPDALEKALTSAREFSTGKLITIFGCGGDRDKGKRPIMAAVASRLSDLTVLTSDNPRTENPDSIIADASKGLLPGKPSLSIADRKEAIFSAIAQATPLDTVVIAGKGHEPYQEINGIRHRFLDEEVARDALKMTFKTT